MKKALILAAALSFSASAVLAEGPVVLANEGQLTKSTQAGAVGSLGGAVGGVAVGTIVAVVVGVGVIATVVGGSGT